MSQTIDAPSEATQAEEPKALQVARGLEEMAAWLREHPNFPTCWAGGSAARVYTPVTLSEEAYAKARQAFIRAGDELSVTISQNPGEFRFTRTFSGNVTLSIAAVAALFATPAESPLPDVLQRSLFATPAESPLPDVLQRFEAKS